MSHFILSESNKKAFSDSHLTEYYKRCIVYLKKHCPERAASLGEGDLNFIVQKGLEQARKFGLQYEFETMRFTEMSLTLSPTFHSTNPYISVLHDYEIYGDEKIRRLYDAAILTVHGNEITKSEKFIVRREYGSSFKPYKYISRDIEQGVICRIIEDFPGFSDELVFGIIHMGEAWNEVIRAFIEKLNLMA